MSRTGVLRLLLAGALVLVIGGVAFFLTYLASYPWRYRIIEGLIAPVTWLILHLAGYI